MKWIGPKEAKTAASKGLEEALKCSIEHWRQLSHRPKHIMKAIHENLTSIYGKDCALCSYYHTNCFKCIAGSEEGMGKCCNGLWVKASYAFYADNAIKFTKAAIKVWEYLKSLQ